MLYIIDKLVDIITGDFIREIQKILPAKVWSDIVAKVPECQKRTQCTYSTLVKINKAA